MKLRSIRNATYFGLGSIISKVANLLALPLFAHSLSIEEFGSLNLVQSISTPLLILFCLALDRSIFRVSHDYHTDSELRLFYGNIAILETCSTVIFSAILLVMPSFLSGLLPGIPFFPTIAYAIVAYGLQGFALIPLARYRLDQRAGTFFVVTIVQLLLNLVCTLFFVVFLKGGVEGYFLGLALSYLTMVPFYFWKTISISTFRLDGSILRNAVSFSWPLIPGLLAAWAINQSDRIFLANNLTLDQLAIYSVSGKLCTIMAVSCGAILQVYQPHFFKLAKAGDQESIEKLGMFQNGFILLVLTAGTLTAVFSREIVLLLMPKGYIGAYFWTNFMIWPTMFAQVTGIFSLVAYQRKRTKATVGLTLVSGTLSVVLNAILVPLFGIPGSIISAVTSLGFLMLSHFLLARATMQIPVSLALVVLGLGVSLTIILANLAFDVGLHWDPRISLVFKLAILVLGMLLVAKKTKSFFAGVFAR